MDDETKLGSATTTAVRRNRPAVVPPPERFNSAVEDDQPTYNIKDETSASLVELEERQSKTHREKSAGTLAIILGVVFGVCAVIGFTVPAVLTLGESDPQVAMTIWKNSLEDSTKTLGIVFGPVLAVMVAYYYKRSRGN